MSVQNQPPVWSVKDTIDSKYEKCRNITEEIYKRINITFQIKQLETAAQSDVSDQSEQIDSNELSNETDLFACDKTSISSSTEADKPPAKFVNINNNEEKPKKPVVVYKRPRKRFRKRVKKRLSKQRSESDGSSDEALPLSRIVDGAKDPPAKADSRSESPDRVMGVPYVLILAKDLIKPKLLQLDKKPTKSYVDQKMQRDADKCSEKVDPAKDNALPATEKAEATIEKIVGKEGKGVNYKSCSICGLAFRGERGLRRHVSMSHIEAPPKSKDARPA